MKTQINARLRETPQVRERQQTEPGLQADSPAVIRHVLRALAAGPIDRYPPAHDEAPHCSRTTGRIRSNAPLAPLAKTSAFSLDHA